jgi:hypothetical protein
LTDDEKEDIVEVEEGIQILISVIDAGQIAEEIISEVLVGDDAKMMQTSINTIEQMTVLTFFEATGDFVAIPKPLLDTSIIRVRFVDVPK